MCNCVLCDCLWINLCGVCCAGIHESIFCASCWLCKPDQLRNIDQSCCHCFQWTGYGGNCLCYGFLCCAPRYVKDWANGAASVNEVSQQQFNGGRR